MPLGGKRQVVENDARGIHPVIIPDPGDAGTIDTSHSGYCELTTAGAETRTLGDPAYRGQFIELVFISDGGNCVVTASSPVNQTGNNTITFQDIGDVWNAVGAYNATDGWEWKTIRSDFTAGGLSTV